MRVKNWIKASLTIAVLCLFGWPLHAWPQSSSQQSGSDPVADAARKAREDKKNAAKPKKVYTEDDVKPATSASSANPAGTTASGATAQPRTANGAPDEDPNGEAARRKRFKEQHDKLAKAELELDVLQREVQKSQVEYYPDPQKALSEQNSRKEINDKKAKIDAKQQEIAQIKKDLEDMEEQLRKSGGDPGWAR